LRGEEHDEGEKRIWIQVLRDKIQGKRMFSRSLLADAGSDLFLSFPTVDNRNPDWDNYFTK